LRINKQSPHISARALPNNLTNIERGKDSKTLQMTKYVL